MIYNKNDRDLKEQAGAKLILQSVNDVTNCKRN